MSGKTGFALLNGLEDLGVALTPTLERLCGFIGGEETAHELLLRIHTALEQPPFKENCLCVGNISDIFGSSCKLLIVVGCVDGLIPSSRCFDTRQTIEKRQKVAEVERGMFRALISRASEELILSYPYKEDLAIAERLKLEVRRVRTENGKRIAQLRPCDFIEQMGDSAPGVISGEQSLSDVRS